MFRFLVFRFERPVFHGLCQKSLAMAVGAGLTLLTLFSGCANVQEGITSVQKSLQSLSSEQIASEAAEQGTPAAAKQETPKAPVVAKRNRAMPADAKVIDGIVDDPDVCCLYSGGTIQVKGRKKAHGKGIAQGKDRYEGEFRYGKLHGKGVYTWNDANGGRHEGQFADGVQNGRGRREFIDKEGYHFKIDGEFKDGDLWNGHMSMLGNGNSDSIEQDYKNGKRHGLSITTLSDGRIFEEQWKDGKQVGKSKQIAGGKNAEKKKVCTWSWPARGNTEPTSGRVGTLNISDALWIDNATIRAAADGKVFIVGNIDQYQLVSIRHEPCVARTDYFFRGGGKVLVKEGQMVRRGDKIAEARGRFVFRILATKKGVFQTSKEETFGDIPPANWLPEVGDIVIRNFDGELLGPDLVNPKWLASRFDISLSAGKLGAKTNETLLFARGSGRKLDLNVSLAGKADKALKYPLKVTVRYEALAETKRCATSILAGGEKCAQGRQRLVNEKRSYTLSAPGVAVKDTVPMNLVTVMSGRVLGLGADVQVLSDPEIEANVIGVEAP
ncbi:MAG: hypothetical protein LBR88_10365 [Zoogloeaceae bacterium]|jgi:hypothetical protein|nr:hypothetical protein [Zoogloeaceae bacterium]